MMENDKKSIAEIVGNIVNVEKLVILKKEKK